MRPLEVGTAEIGTGEPDWTAHEARAGHLADLPLHAPLRFRGGGADWAEMLRDAPDEVAVSLLLLQIRSAHAYSLGPYWRELVWHLPGVLGRRRPAVSAADAAWAVRAAAAMPGTYDSHVAMDAASALAVWCDQPDDPGLLVAVEALAATVDAHSQIQARDLARIRKRLRSLRPEVPAGAPLDVMMIRPDDGWSRVVLERAARWQGDPGPANLLLRHLMAAGGSKPSRRWLERAATLLQDPAAPELLRILVESAATAEPVIVRDGGGGEYPLLVSDPNADPLRAACWAASALAADWVVPALHATGGRSMFGSSLAANGYVASAKVPNACVYGLGLIGSEAAIACLLDLQRRVRHAGFGKQIAAALDAAAARAGLTPGELAERVVPDAGLDRRGERLVATSGTAAWVTIGAGWRVRTEWQTPAARSARAPADADDGATRLARLAVKEVKAALTGERGRLEGLLAEERSWAVADWRRWYLDHPVTGSLTRGLIWSFSTGNGTVTGIPGEDGLLDGADARQPVPSEGTVRLWHPARADTAQVRQWRDYLVAVGRAQPFKQAFREVYLITPAELETRLYSNRFAAHVLRYQQAYALFKQRGWTANYLGPYDGGYEGQARRDFPGAGLTACFDHYPVDAGPFAYPVDLCRTDRVSFCRTGDRRRAPINDLVPKLKIAPRLELTGRYLRVQGRLNDYKIHIGSGNVLIEPDDRYLCIVPASGRAKVMLPFEGDQLLSIIISKAALLAADDKITDPAITCQLKGR